MTVLMSEESAPLTIARDLLSLRQIVAGWRAAGLRVGLVPTMGALHEGHLSLVRLALTRAERVVVSIFVNPIQFGPGEDFAAYPRREADDVARLTAGGCHLLYAPDASAMYPSGFATSITVDGVSRGLCGEQRPGHFQGVATVVTKLLLRALPDVAVFGEKDYQQLQVIRRMVTDLDIPVEIVGGPTQREADGLALSSRNAYLSASERAIAPRLFQTLTDCAGRLAVAGAVAAPVLGEARDRLLAAGFNAVDYLDLRDAETLVPLDRVETGTPGRLLAAVRLGRTRLIDNMAVTRKAGA